MDFLIYLLLFVQFLIVLTSIVGLPGNIISLIVPLGFAFFNVIKWKIFILILAIIIAGEIIEFAFGYFSGKFYGINSKSFWSSVLGAIILGILMAPLFFGLGAVIGIFLGTFIGTFFYEFFTSKDMKTSLKRSFLSLFSKITATTIKIGLGCSTVIICFYNI